MKSVFILLLFSLIHCNAMANNKITELSLNTDTGVLKGTLINVEKSDSVALIIAGSGPTDRNGNNPMMKNDSLKLLAEGLADKGVSSFRFDKRGIAASQPAAISENDLRFEHFVNDVSDWVNLLKPRYKRVFIVGHSEGSLIGMLSSQQSGADGFISIAGAGQRIDRVLREQLQAQPAAVYEQSTQILDTLLAGNKATDVPVYLNALFRDSIQGYMISWLRYDPQSEINKLNIPVLIAQGTTDIQVSVEQAELLAAANKKAKLIIIDGMNHVLKQAPQDRLVNIQTYSNPSLPIDTTLVATIADFINQ